MRTLTIWSRIFRQARRGLPDGFGEARATPQESKQDHRRIKELERDPTRKEKALAETAGSDFNSAET